MDSVVYFVYSSLLNSDLFGSQHNPALQHLRPNQKGKFVFNQYTPDDHCAGNQCYKPQLYKSRSLLIQKTGVYTSITSLTLEVSQNAHCLKFLFFKTSSLPGQHRMDPLGNSRGIIVIVVNQPVGIVF